MAAALCTVFTQQRTVAVEEQWDQVAAMLTGTFPRVADLMATAREDVLAPASHWRKPWSTNPLGGGARRSALLCERIKEIGQKVKDCCYDWLITQTHLDSDCHARP